MSVQKTIAQSAENIKQSAPPIDLQFLSAQAGDDRMLVEELLHMFVKQVRGLANTMNNSDDIEAILSAAHTLKGTARAVGALAIEESAEAVENASAARSQVKALNAEIDAACDYVASLLR
ncbi:MAG: Hpt domain-containing protein [Pseudomonadota bacterium]